MFAGSTGVPRAIRNTESQKRSTVTVVAAACPVAVNHPGKKVVGIKMNSSLTASDVARCSTLVDVLCWRAAVHPERTAYTFLQDGGALEVNVTFAELDRRARAIAVLLAELGVEGERALLLLPSGIEYITAFFGCLYAGVIAVPAFPIQPRCLHRDEAWFHALMSDAQPLVAFAPAEISRAFPEKILQDPGMARMHWLSARSVDDALADTWNQPAGTSDIAFLQYTSGSTSTPKGVMVTHHNLIHNQHVIQTACSHTEESTVVSWLPLHHDMGLIGTVLQPVFVGSRSVLMPPARFLQEPSAWLKAISQYQAHSSSGPNFAYDLCSRRVSAEQKQSLDLSSWRNAVNGAEPVRWETMERFAESFASCGFRKEAFRPCYGLAESTLMVTGARRQQAPSVKEASSSGLEQNIVREPAGREDARLLAGCGGTLHGQIVKVVDPATRHELPERRIGEIWIGGPSVTRGYWGRREETEHSFQAYTLPDGQGPFLRSGDLGFLDQGELFLTGRLKDLIIIRGRNLYPHDIEAAVQRAHSGLRPGCGAAFTVEVNGDEVLAVVNEVERHPAKPLEELVSLVRKEISIEFGIHAYSVVLVKTGAVPKTTSGKIKRGECRSLFRLGRLAVLAESTEPAPAPGATDACGELTKRKILEMRPDLRHEFIESHLREKTAKMLKLNPEQIDAGQPLVAFGLDSLRAIELSDSLGSEIDLDLDAVELLHTITLADLVSMILDQLDLDDEARVARAEETGTFVAPID